MAEGGLEIVVGTYENFLLGFSLSCQEESNGQSKYSLKPSFTNNSHCGSIRCISSFHKFIASGSTDEVIRLLNMVSRTEHGILQQQNGTITCLTSHQSYLFSGSDDGTICIWKQRSWECEKTLHAHPEGVLGLSIHPSGKLALSIGRDKALKTWNLVKGRHGYTTNLKAIADAVQFSTLGNYYAVSVSNRLDVYSLSTARVIYTISFTKKILHIIFLKKHALHMHFPKLAFRIASFGVNVCDRKELGFSTWIFNNESPIIRKTSTHNNLTTNDSKVSRDDIVAVGGDQDSVDVHNVSLGEKSVSYRAHKSRVKDMKFLPSQKFLLTASNCDGHIRIWNFPDDNFTQAPTLVTEVDTTCRVTCLAVWDKSVVLTKKTLTEDHQILQEAEGEDDDENTEEVEIDMEQKSTSSNSRSRNLSSAQEERDSSDKLQIELREHRKPKRRKIK